MQELLIVVYSIPLGYYLPYYIWKMNVGSVSLNFLTYSGIGAKMIKNVTFIYDFLD